MHSLIRFGAVLPLLLVATRLTAQTPCGTWTVVPVPIEPDWTWAQFEDVAALPNGDVWAVGAATLASPIGPEMVTVAMRWDGSAWTHTPTPYTATFPGGANDALHAVAALAPDDVWAAGEREGDAGGLAVGAWLLVEHWDGSSWELVPVPGPSEFIDFSGTRVFDIVAFAPDDIWFAGAWGEANDQLAVTWRPLAMHWDGSHLSVAPTPVLSSAGNTVNMRQMSALAPDDIWGVCRTNKAGGETVDPFVLHYDGSDWSQVTLPGLGSKHVLDDIVALASDDVWVFGHWYFTPGAFALHWNGSAWSQVAAPAATTVAALGPGQFYVGTSVISLFDGTSTAVVETFPGVVSTAVLSLEPAGSCALWAVGRRFGSQGDLAPFAARMDPDFAAGTWTALGGGLAGAQGVPVLVGEGSLAPGSPVQLALSGAAVLAPAVIIVGLSELDAPFKGGVLVPAPDILLAGLQTNGLGELQLSGTWPANAPSGLELIFQAWITDVSAPAGLSASGGLGAKTP